MNNFQPNHSIPNVGKYINIDATGKKVYHCSSCGYRTYDIKVIICHIDKHHLLFSQYNCGECLYAKGTRDQLKNHYNTAHPTSNTTSIKLTCFCRSTGDMVDSGKINLWSMDRRKEFDFMNNCLCKVQSMNYAQSHMVNKVNHAKGI